MAHDMASPEEIQTDVENGIAFGSANLWVLVFAILIASVGLNVNSAAVVIGAMLISPLMGPIVGIGYGAATMEVDLIKRGLKSLLTATGISLGVSATYFFLTPLTDAGTELLARTAPSTWDVLIALFGGAAGAVGTTRCERGNVIPGVAIATALMPPICTAGYGLATAQWDFMIGALYLFSINTVFISLATFLVIRILPLPQHAFVDKQQARRVKFTIWAVALLTAVPSVYLAVNIVRTTTFEHNAAQFVEEQIDTDGASVITSRFDAQAHTINVLLAGQQLSVRRLDSIQAQLAAYKLAGAQLTVRQGIAQLDSADIQSFRSGLLSDAARRSQQVLAGYDERFRQLQRLMRRRPFSDSMPASPALLREARVWNPAVRQLALNRLIRPATDSLLADTMVVASVTSYRRLSASEQARLADWLQQRTGGRWAVRLLADVADPNAKKQVRPQVARPAGANPPN